ncbi:MAG: tyrosine-type recombinase/integrase [Lactobacillus iners]|jgi:hypothetical protein|uniref:Tyrosine-type recombinase/integrase n=1 Tax=Lactobacillus iners TaxID=147802 RepID=A0A6G7BLW2_9LACO|nr:tyrosine-type recombinase/integrase [Lactobacillus iners]MCT7749700.1 tyrosine-type recombinase/integrase [Lactobacillus gasseri]EFQ48412.1 site-specific recombinase, phage integrase family [Lactobacillus iners LEAF 2053A-b]MCT7672365.1 tyrosine-type recombinase/integrase [Lactobacillus iners]MCT7683649.1 tyrosine-type recombinase/integrase [Lactobacillus iners]MCT7710153.1 tyrosine-type recombinase/integrase [Lactobacillus iners]
MKQVVKPIKDSWILNEVENCLLSKESTGIRNYTIFQVGKSTLLRVSDVLSLKKTDVYDEEGLVKRNAYIIDKKTSKRNILYLKPVETDLQKYLEWLKTIQSNNRTKKIYKSTNFNGNVLTSPWLFPSIRHAERHIDGKAYWKIMNDVGHLLNIDYLGTHTMRKTGAYRVYQQTNHNIGLVMKLLNHSSEAMTLAYLGLDQDTREHILDTIDFG